MKRRKFPPTLHIYMPAGMRERVTAVAAERGFPSRNAFVLALLEHYLGNISAIPEAPAAPVGKLFE